MEPRDAHLERSFERITGMLAIFLLAAGCVMVVYPFLTALLWAIILAYSTWPVFSWLDRHLGGRKAASATAMTLLVTLVLLLPFGTVIATLADDTTRLVAMMHETLVTGLPAPPSWLTGLPYVGEIIAEQWRIIGQDAERLTTELRKLGEPATKFALAAAGAIGRGMAELVLSVFIAFFLYRSGAAVAIRTRTIMNKFTAHTQTENLLEVAGSTVRFVVYGIIGTALSQGILAGIGLWIAGVPGALSLGFATFVLSLIPMGPPLVWVPATIWLAVQGETGWAVFLGAWGLFVISGVDNFLKPYLISKGGDLPLVLVFLGALGGVLAFGFVGLFLGPTLLAVAFNLVNHWTAAKTGASEMSADDTAM